MCQSVQQRFCDAWYICVVEVSFESITTTERAHATTYSFMLLKPVSRCIRLDVIMSGVFNTDAFAPVARGMIVILRTKMGFEVTFKVGNSLVLLFPTTLGTDEVDAFDGVAVYDSNNGLRAGLGGLLVARWWSRANAFCCAVRRVRRQRRPCGSLGA